MAARRYARYNPLFVYTEVYQTTLEDAIRLNEEKLREWELRQHGLRCLYKTKATPAGRMLEVEVSPAFLDRVDYRRARKQQRSSVAKKRRNDELAQRKLVRLVHSNFVPGDIFFTGGFSDDRQPESLEACREEIRNFIKRLQYHARRAGAEDGIRYIYVIEMTTLADGRTKYHVHMLLSRNAGANRQGTDARDWIEDRWTGGDYANTKQLQWKRGGGFTGISTYFTKQFQALHAVEQPGLRRWGQSLGLKQSTGKTRESCHRFRKRQVASMIRAPATMKERFEREFPGYAYLEEYPCEVRYCDVVDGVYLYCRMYRKE